MSRIRSAFAIALAIAATACATTPRGATVAARLDEPFRLAQGETASVGDERLAVRFAEVVSESRCPVGVQCVRAGEARVRFELRLPGAEPEAVILATEGAQPRHASYGAYDVHLVTLEPQPRTDVPRPAYVATLRVVRR
ncbi:MAG TPA: hypothetical protein VFS20_17480 [Longimicrobium sp.]|nr:hypothetical protein [Longimicrobium sp.]